MFNISQVGKILKATNRLNMPTEFNASLPITIEVKKQINPIRYILKLGKKEVETKSYSPLEIGGKYKAQINQTDNKIEIKNLKKIPNIFNKFPNSIKYGIDDLLKDDPLKSPDKYKTFLMKNLAQANNQQEFVFYSQMLLALNQEVYHLFINDEKKSLIQLKPKKKKLKFYGFFENLGGIGGEIYLIDEIYLDLMVEFQNSLYLIEKNLDELKGVIINSIKQEKTTPLFEVSENSLLNLKG
jgi:hypothetical protein